MNPLYTTASMICLLALASCAGSGKGGSEDRHLASEGLSERLNRSYGYQVDEGGNWVPKTDKRSQYEGRGGAASFNRSLDKKAYHTDTLRQGAWTGSREVDRPVHRMSGSRSAGVGPSRFNSQQAQLDRNLETPARIEGNHLSRTSARETGASGIARPSDAETDARRRVFTEPDIIDYRQQRELSIQQSKQLLGRDR